MRLITADEENRHPTGIECKQDAQISASRPRLLHICVTRSLDRIDERSSKSWALILENLDRNNDGFLLVLIEDFKPGFKLIGVLDLPRHTLEYNLCIV